MAVGLQRRRAAPRVVAPRPCRAALHRAASAGAFRGTRPDARQRGDGPVSPGWRLRSCALPVRVGGGLLLGLRAPSAGMEGRGFCLRGFGSEPDRPARYG